jgi:sugar phosphate isomerase/epimerase
LNNQPRIACCNFIPDVQELRAFALENGFDGIEWSLRRAEVPSSDEEAGGLARQIEALHPLEVRYHCAFQKTDLGDIDAERSREAMRVFRQVCCLVGHLGGEVVTIHVGLGHDSTLGLSWERTIDSLAHLVRYAESIGVRLCLENLAWGWTSRPELYEKLIRKAGPWATLDIGHAWVSPSVTSQHYSIEDFVGPHPERFLGAHIYHSEDDSGHVAPRSLDEIAGRLRLLRRLPACDWWVLEVRERAGLLQTLSVVREFLTHDGANGRHAAQ